MAKRKRSGVKRQRRARKVSLASARKLTLASTAKLRRRLHTESAGANFVRRPVLDMGEMGETDYQRKLRRRLERQRRRKWWRRMIRWSARKVLQWTGVEGK